MRQQLDGYFVTDSHRARKQTLLDFQLTKVEYLSSLYS